MLNLKVWIYFLAVNRFFASFYEALWSSKKVRGKIPLFFSCLRITQQWLEDIFDATGHLFLLLTLVFIFIPAKLQRVGVSLAKYFSIICISPQCWLRQMLLPSFMWSWAAVCSGATQRRKTFHKSIPRINDDGAQKKKNGKLFTRNVSCPINDWKIRSWFRRNFVYFPAWASRPPSASASAKTTNTIFFGKWRNRIFMTFPPNEKMFRPLNRNWDFFSWFHFCSAHHEMTDPNCL